jgi:hypothetical protein
MAFRTFCANLFPDLLFLKKIYDDRPNKQADQQRQYCCGSAAKSDVPE